MALLDFFFSQMLIDFLNLVQVLSLLGSYTKKQLVWGKVILNLRRIHIAASCFLPYEVVMKFIFLKITSLFHVTCFFPFFFLTPLLYLTKYTFISESSYWYQQHQCGLNWNASYKKWNLFSFPTLIFTTEKKDSLQKWLEIKTGDPKAWVWRCVYIHQGRDLRTTQSELQNPWRLNLSFFKAGCLHLKYYLLNIVGEKKT